MDDILVIIGLLAAVLVLVVLFEFRIRQPDVLVLYEFNEEIRIRKGLIYPRHFSLRIKRTTLPIRLTLEVTAAGNLEVVVKLIGSVAPARAHLQALIRVGGWHSDAVARAAEEAQILLQGLVKEYAEHAEIHALTSTGILNFLNEHSDSIRENLGIDIISLAVQSLEPTDPEIASALRQQEQARLYEQTEQLNQQARASAAKARYQADEEIALMDHTLELKKAELTQILLEQEAAQAHQRLEDELKRKRLRLAFEKEEIEVLKSSPELLMLTPQAARLAEASQNLKNARTVISFTPQELAHGSELITLLQNMLQKALDAKDEASSPHPG